MKKLLNEWRQYLKEQEMSQEDFRKMQVGKYAEAMNDLLDQDRSDLTKSEFPEEIVGTFALSGFATLVGLAMEYIPNQVDDFIAKYEKDPKGATEDVLAVSLPRLADLDYKFIGPEYYDDSHYTQKLMDYYDKARKSRKIKMDMPVDTGQMGGGYK